MREIFGLMQDKQLMISDFIGYAQKYHARREIVSRDEEGKTHRYTYGEAGPRARKLSSALLQAGVERGDRIATLAMNGYRHFELFYGVSGIGAILHTVNPRLFEEQLVYILEHAGSTMLFVDPAFIPLARKLVVRLPATVRVVVLADHDVDDWESYESFIRQGDPLYGWPVFDERTASSLCYTSGTTGNPKGVLYSHRSTVLHALAAAQRSAMGLAADDVIMPLAPMFHANAWSTPYLAPMVGAKLVLPGPRLDGKSVQSLIAAEGVTFTVAVPTVFTMLFEYLDASGSRIESLKRAVIGGSPVPPPMIERLASLYGCTVLQVWGMTETSPLGTMCTPTPALDALPSDDQRKKLQTAGRVQYGMELKIIGPSGERHCHDGKSPGDLWVRSGWAAKGYFRDETSKLDADGWFPTGDVATIDDFGYMRITDRTKDVIKSGGEWISSVDVESIVYAHPAVKMAAVVGAAHPKWEERPVLIVALKEGELVSEGELIDFMRPRMARWWLPDRVLFVREMPMTATGKIRKTVLREEYREILLSHAVASQA
jgi:acyl-CoA synthetase (AMP-forming)/AMP-acid ligase II